MSISCADDPPDLVAGKLLRVNLSDLAAMGAEPLGYLTVIARPPDIDRCVAAALRAGPRGRPGSASAATCSAATRCRPPAR